MIDYRVIRLTTGESFLCMLIEDCGDEITVAFPLLITKQIFPVAQNVMREVHSTSSFCPFTDDKHFTFMKKDLQYNKPMNKDAIPYYVEMLNKQEEADDLRAYGYEELVKPDDFADIEDIVDEKMKNLARRVRETEDDADDEDYPSSHSGNKTVH